MPLFSATFSEMSPKIIAEPHTVETTNAVAIVPTAYKNDSFEC